MASRLELRNDFVELLPQHMPQVQMIRQVIDKTGGLGYQTVMVVSPDRQKNLDFLRDLRSKLLGLFWQQPLPFAEAIENQRQRLKQILWRIGDYERYPSVDLYQQISLQIEYFDREAMVEYAFHRYEKQFFLDRRLLLVEQRDLEEIYRRIKKRIDYEVRRRQPGFIDLLGEDPPEIDLKDIENKYQKQIGTLPDSLEVKEGDLWYSALIMRPRGIPTDLIFSQTFVDRLQQTVAELKPQSYHAQMNVDYMGGFTANLREYNGIARDLQRSIFSTALLLLLLLLGYFRRLRVLILIPLPLIVGMSVSFGFAWLSIGYLNTATGFIGALLLGLGIDYGIYWLDRYLREREEGYDVAEAIFRTHTRTGKALTTSTTTTAVAFLSLLLCRFTGFSQFGLITGVGILCCLLSILTVMPAMVTLMERKRSITRARSMMPTPKLYSPFPLALPLVLLTVVWLVASFSILHKVPFEYNMKKLGFQEGGLLQQAERWKRFEKLFPQGMNPVVFLVDTEEEARKLTAEIERRGQLDQKQRGADKPIAVKGAFSAFTFVPQAQHEKQKILAKITDLLEEHDVEDIITDPQQKKLLDDYQRLLDAKPYTAEDLPDYLKRDLVIYKKGTREIEGYLVVVISGLDLSDGRQNQELNDILVDIQIGQKRFDPSGEAIILAKLLRVIDLDSMIAILSSLLAVALLVFVDLRSLRLTLIALWPLLAGLFGVMLFLVLLDIRLSLFNMVVLPALLGIAIDAGVHTIHRYREKPELGTLGVQVELLGPITIASITTVISFATMITGEHLGLRSVGTLAVAGLLCCLFSAVILLPALMELIFRRKPLQK